MKKNYSFYIYIVSNPSRTVLYIGFTNNLTRRLWQHINSKGDKLKFATKYYCNELIFYEIYQYVSEALEREKQFKRWSRKKKEVLINSFNPSWNNLNARFLYSVE